MDKNRYNLLAWHKLAPNLRVDLVPLIEGVRKGANIQLWKLRDGQGNEYYNMQKACLEECLDAFGLYRHQTNGDYYISSDKEFLRQVLHNEIITGEFLGYPKCCIKSFEIGCAIFMESRNTKDGPAVVFFRKLAVEMQSEDLDDAIFYALHVPCSVRCKKTLRMSKRVKEVLVSKDPEAARHQKEAQKAGVYKFHYLFDCHSPS